MERGAGFGFRWKSPIGPVRIDFASAISQDGQPWRVHLNIGPDL
ncbi:MAG TPA: BamA/TamA family outer membrane protein [Gammaproteobacteria bacterium]